MGRPGKGVYLQWLQEDFRPNETETQMTKTVVITSGKGGVGKTNISVNSAVELSRLGYRTCLFDADLGLANVNILLGINPEHTLEDFVFRGRPLDDIIQKTTYGFDIIPGSSGVEKMADLSRQQTIELLEAFSQLRGYDYFLIDTSSGISTRVISFCLAASQTILVLTAESTSLTDAYAVLKVLALKQYKGTVGILINRGESVPRAKKTYLHFKTVVKKHLNIHIAPVGVVLDDHHVEESITRQRPLLSLYPDCVGSQCIRAMVNNIVRSEKEEEKDIGTFWANYFEFMQADERQGGSRDDGVAESRGRRREEHETETAVPPETTRQAQLPEHGHGQSVPYNPTHGLWAGRSLPSPVPLLFYALKMHNSGELCLEKLTALVSSDVALMGRIVQSLSLNGQRQFDERMSVGGMIEKLGVETVNSIVLTTAVQSALLVDEVDRYSFSNSFWAHSYRCAIVSRLLATQIGYPFPEEAYLAGLLHDVGRLAQQTNSPERYFLSPCSYGHLAEIQDAEKDQLGMTHAGVGALVLRQWGCSSTLADAARYHDADRSKIATGLGLTRLVFCARWLCDPLITRNVAETLGSSLLEITAGQMWYSKEEADEEMARAAGLYDISLENEETADSMKERMEVFKRAALDYTMLSGVLPRTSAEMICGDAIRHVHHGLQLLFGFSRVICLLPDAGGLYLRAAGYPDCYAAEFLSDVVFSVKSENNQIVEVLRQGEDRVLGRVELRTIAEKQLISVMGSKGLFCFPLGSKEQCKGVIVVGIDEWQEGLPDDLRKRLRHFGRRAALSLTV